MNRKNVVVAGGLALTMLLCSCGNQVSKVPVANADEKAEAAELSFLYKHEEKLQDMQRQIDEKVQKEKIKKEAEERRRKAALAEAQKKAEDLERQKEAEKKAEDLERKKEAEKRAVKLAQSKSGSRNTDKEKKSSHTQKSYNVPLDKDLLKYINKLCSQLGISETMVLGLIKTESNFNSTLISDTNDYGLMQINRQNFDWLSKELKEEFGISFDWEDPYDNVTAGIYYLFKVKKDWVSTYSGDALQHVTLLSYNMGPGNAKKYLKSHSASDWKYVKKVIGYKEKIEKGESLG